MPKKTTAKTSAERVKAFRERKKDAGLKRLHMLIERNTLGLLEYLNGYGAHLEEALWWLMDFNLRDGVFTLPPRLLRTPMRPQEELDIWIPESDHKILTRQRGLTAGDVIEILLLSHSKLTDDPTFPPGTVVFLNPDFPKEPPVAWCKILPPELQKFDKYKDRAEVREWYRVGRYEGEPNPRIKQQKEVRAMEDPKYQAAVDNEERARLACLKAQKEEARIDRLRVMEIRRMMAGDEIAEKHPPQNAHTEREAQRHAEYLRSTGVVKKPTLTAEERSKAEWEAANDGDWSVNTTARVEPEEPCPTCGQPFEVDPSGFCTNCHDQILRAKDARYDHVG
jgi:hypothetical protein